MDQEQIKRRLQDIEDLLRMHAHHGFDLSQKLIGTALNQVKLVNDSVLGDGLENSGTLELKIAEGKGDVEIRAGIDSGDFSNAGGKSGFIIGIDDSDSNKIKFYFGTTNQNVRYDGATLTVDGGVSVDEIHIGGNDATSAHIDTDGNFWTGADESSFSTAPASISNAGLAKFKNIQIGGATLQYQITNAGILSFGDGSDGDHTTTGNESLTSDMYYDNLTVATGHTIDPAGYRIFCKTSLTLAGTGKIARNGNNGSNGGSGTGGAGGAALADGYLKGSAVGGTGGFLVGGVGPTAAVAAAAVSNSIGSSGGSGGNGGTGASAGESGASGGGASASNVKLIANWHLATLLDVSSTGSTVKFNNSGSGGGGGYGQQGTGNGNSTGGGGGGGSAGGLIAIYAKSLTIGASASITATGGNGGNGADGGNGGANGGQGGGGGGGGGAGGVLVLVYNELTNSGTLSAAAGTGGTAGNGGTGTPAGGNGTAGSNGSAGVIYQFQISM